MKVKQRLTVPAIATSGRWSKRDNGEWGFDFEEPVNKHDEESEQAGTNSDDENGETHSSSNDSQQANENDQTARKVPNTIPDNKTSQQAKSSSNTNQDTVTPSSSTTTTTQSTSLPSATTSNLNNQEQQALPPIHLVLRMRDEKKELQDIKFDFLPNKDTVEEISNELVNAKLIDAIDIVVVSANLNKLLENHSISPITFPLVN